MSHICQQITSEEYPTYGTDTGQENESDKNHRF